MSDEGTQAGNDGPTGPLAGERLAEARRLRKISLPDIARELHLDEPKVQALEENRFELLGAPVFAKGHLRKYAEMVGVPIETVMADYHILTNADDSPPVVGEARKRQRDINIAPWLLAIPLLLVILAVAYWWFGRAAQELGVQPAVELPSTSGRLPPRSQEPTPAPVASESAAENSPAPVNIDADAAANTPAVAEPEPETRAVSPAESASTGQLQLRLTFSGDCWTEVTDADGERLFFDLGKSGRTVNLNGKAPLRLLLGDTNNVRVTVNGQPYNVASANAEFRGDTARLTINR